MSAAMARRTACSCCGGVRRGLGAFTVRLVILVFCVAVWKSAGLTASGLAVPQPRRPRLSLRIHTTAATEEALPEPEGGYLAACLAVKDQPGDLREWIEHHQALGISKFYIFDNNSTVPLLDEVWDYVQSGLVQYQYIVEFDHPTDEFLIIRDNTTSLPTLLHDYEAYGGLAVNWQVFGSSGLKTRSQKDTLSTYYKCFARDHVTNHHVKSIVNTRFTEQAGADPHHFIYEDGYFAVNEAFQPVGGAKSVEVSIDRIALYHYVTKSLEEYQSKMARGSAMKNNKTMHFFVAIEVDATHNCTDALHLGRRR